MPRLARWLPPAVLGGLAVLLFRPVLFRGETFFAFDVLSRFFPWASLHAARPRNELITDPVQGLVYPLMHQLQAGLRTGEVPLWNPFAFTGTYLAPQSNPLEYLTYGTLPLTVAHDVLLALYVLASGAFTYLLLRELRLSLAPALLGAVAWMLNGHVMVWLEFEQTPLMAATLPLTLWLLERWLRTRSFGALLGLVAAAALSLCSDFVQLVVYQWGFAALYALVRCGAPAMRDHPPLEAFRRQLVPLGLAFVVAIGIGANTFTGGLAALEGTHRSSIPFSQLHERTGVLPIEYLATAIFPDFYGSPAREGAFPPKPGPGYSYNNYNELCLYAGVVPLLLAFVGALRLREPLRALLASVALLSVWMAAGSVLYWPIATFFPGLDLTTPTRILYLAGFAIAVLAAFGLEDLLEGKARRSLAAPLLGACAAASLAIAAVVQSDAGIAWAVERSFEPERIRELLPSLRAHFALSGPVLAVPLVLLGLGLAAIGSALFATGTSVRGGAAIALVALASLDGLDFAARYNTTSPRQLAFPETGVIERLRADETPFRVVSFGKFLHNGFLPFGIHDVGGYASFYPTRFGELAFVSQHGVDAPLPAEFPRWLDFERFGSPLFDLWNVRYVVAPPGSRIASPRLEVVYDGEVRLFRNRGALPRAFVVPAYELAIDPAAARRAVGTSAREDFLRRVVLEAPPPASHRGLTTGEASAGSTVSIVEYAPNRVVLRAEATAAGFLVISDAYHPAWRAHVDGEPVEILRANYTMRAVPIEAGRSLLQMEFRPRAVRAGLAVTAAGWSLLGLVALGALLRRQLR